MQTEKTLFDSAKILYKTGGILIKLIFINTIVFLVLGITTVIGRLSGFEEPITRLLTIIFAQETDISLLIYRPWGIITNMFSHFGLFHFLFNMISLYYFGRLFSQFFDEKRLLYTYILGGVFCGGLEVIAQFLPTIQPHPIIGASGAIMAIIAAVLFYAPRTKVNLFGAIELPFYVLAILFILVDFLSLGVEDGTAHFGHIGGVILGMISVQQINSSGNIINTAQRGVGWFLGLFRGFNKRSNMRVQRNAGKPQRNTRQKTDEEYNMDLRTREEELNYILDKISKSGYPSLTKKEKDFLFRQSKK
ncbi:MAG: rhomboid family intramembrane serine protease [Crocinitomicaceae bacterium]|nr:rhomboid family intramembrane serine protease [Crocinitomicaceae bacterium]